MTQSKLIFPIPLFVFIGIGNAVAQSEDEMNHHPCGTEATIEHVEYMEAQRAELQLFMAAAKEKANRAEAIPSFTSIPVKIHIIRKSNGTGGLTATDINNIMNRMNSYYHNAFLDFYMCGGINFINSDNYWSFDGQTDEAGLTTTHDVANVINMYFTDTVRQGSSNLCGYAYFPPGPDHMFMDNQCSIGTRTTVEHEMGHYLGLYHTHGTSNCGTTNELVNGSNCATAGDDVCDTPADPNLLTPTACNSYLVNGSCVYTGGTTYKDANNQVYNPNTRNIMSYSRPTCRNEFSAGQYVRARYFAQRSRSDITCSSFKVDFTSANELGCDGPRTVNFMAIATGASSYKWHFGDGSTSTVTNPSHTYTITGTYDVSLQITDASSNSISAFKPAHIDLTSKTLNYAQDFDMFSEDSWAASLEDKWKNIPTLVDAGFRWNVWNGTTPSSGSTGPSTDNSGTGHYVYTEASFVTPNTDSAMLITPCFNLAGVTGVPYLEFYYHMWASNASNSMGSLHVDANTGTGWIRDITAPLIGRQQSTQNAAYLARRFSLISFANSKVRFRFRGQYTGSFMSDMAIDNFRIYDSTSSPLNTELLQFEARRIDQNQNILNWFLANSDDYLGSRIFKSNDGNRFFDLTELTTSDFKSGKGSYLDIEKEDAYYKLIAEFKDGTVVESSVRFVEGLKNNLLSAKLHPNPSNGLVQISNLIPDFGAVLILSDLAGKLILQKQVKSNASGQLQFDVSKLDSGIYLVELQSGNTSVSRKLVKF